MSLQGFKTSQIGEAIKSILMSDAAIRRMEEKSRLNRPAVEAIGVQVTERIGPLTNDQKKMVGRWVREVLEQRGWTPDRKARVSPGHAFNRGTVYRRPILTISTADGRERMERARALVRQLPEPPMSVDELISERRREFEAEQ